MVVSQAKLLKTVLKHDGNESKAAKALGIKQQSVNDRIKRNPAIKKAILNVREEALKKSGLSRAFVYKGIKEGCKSRMVVVKDGVATLTKIIDRDTSHKYLKTALELHKDLDPDKEQSVQNIGAIIFQVLTNPDRKRIEVI